MSIIVPPADDEVVARIPTQSTTIVNVHQSPVPVVVSNQGPGMLIRIVWYVCIGWWLSGLVMWVAAIFIVTVIGIPLGLALVNRLPGVLTLRPVTQVLAASVGHDGVAHYSLRGAEQRAMWQRTLYFVFVGWWVCLLSMTLAWLLSVTLVGLPLGLMLLNRIPAATTLRRN